MITALERINIEHDCQLVVQRWENEEGWDVDKFRRHKTGERPPDEMEYVELQRGESGSKLGVQNSRRRAV